MRFTVVACGGEGDTRPIAALCRGLMDAGHEVCFFSEESTLSFAASLGVRTRILAGDTREAMPSGHPMQALHLTDIITAGKKVMAVANDNAASRMRAIAEHAQASDGILFSTFALFAGLIVAQALGKPAIGLWFQPITPTREFLSPMLRPVKVPGWANRMSYSLLQGYLWRTLGRPAAAAHREVFGTQLNRKPKLDFPILYGISPHLLRQPRDWPPGHCLCGHWHHSISDWQPPEDLLEFLSAEPPLYIGFGSSSSFVRGRALTALIDAVAGRHAIFSPGWSRIDSGVLPSNFFVLDQVPHSWLFPRTSMVIHHGGAGTTHAAAHAGIPSVILPVGGDQFFWANLAANAGVAPRHVKGAGSDARTIASMIEFARRDDVRERARALGAAMSQEDGIGTAVCEIEKYMSYASGIN